MNFKRFKSKMTPITNLKLNISNTLNPSHPNFTQVFRVIFETQWKFFIDLKLILTNTHAIFSLYFFIQSIHSLEM